MKTKKLYYIKERHNPQLGKPYYTAYGQLSKRAAKDKEGSLYGYNVMLKFESKEEYQAEIERLINSGHNVYYA